MIYIFTHEPFFSFDVIFPKRSFPASIRRANITLSCFGMQNMQFVDYYRQYADEDSEESREEVAADETSETEKLFFTLERAEAVMEAFENLNYRERAIVSAHLGFCMECYSTVYYDNEDLNENGKPKRKSLPKEAFIDIAIDHSLA